MKQLLIYMSNDPYSHQLKLYKQLNEYGGNTEQDLKDYAEVMRKEFSKKNFSALHLLMLDIQLEKGAVEIILNEYGTHPLKTRLEINPKAVSKDGKEGKLKVTLNEHPWDFLNAQPGLVQHVGEQQVNPIANNF